MGAQKRKVLVVEDELDVQELIKKALEVNYEIDTANSSAEAISQALKNFYDLILLDIGLPDGNGYQVCSRLKVEPKTKNIPVIFVTCYNDINEKLLGFKVGGDDYIVKPFNLLELKARVNARIKKDSEDRTQKEIVNGNFMVNIPERRLYLLEGKERKLVALTRTEYKLFTFLLQHCDEVISRSQLIHQIWGNSVHITNRTVDSHISKLRKKIEPYGNHVQTVHGVGFRFSAQSH